MAEMLLLNPGKRRKARKSTAAKRRRNPIRMANPVRRRRRKNPISFGGARRAIGRAARRVTRRRRNPIGLGGLKTSSILAAFKDALIGGAGAVAVDFAFAKVSPMLPASLQRTPGKVGAGDAVKALFTVVLGRLLSKPTRGMSMKMAAGSLTVQAHGIVKSMLPDSLGLGEFDDGVGYYTPAQVVDGSAIIGPSMGMYVNGYTEGGTLLSDAGDDFGDGPLLSSAQAREGVSQYR